MAKNKSFNKLVAGTMTAAMVAGVVAPVAASAAENTFKDVPAGDWSEKAINDMAAKGIIKGIGGDLFGYGQKTTRGQVATFMVKAKGLDITSDASSFSDVADSMYAKFIATAEKNKIMSGIGNGKFGPDQELTRAQMAQILVNAYGFKADENNKKTFDDIDNLGWATAKSSIETLASLDIVKGKGAGKFDPNGIVTREEAAQFIYNAMNYKVEAGIESVNAVSTTKAEIKFSKPVEKLAKEDVKVAKKANNDKLLVKDVKLSEDKKSATVEFYSDVEAKQVYTVDATVAGKTLSSEMTVGSLEAKTIEMADQTVVADTATDLKFAVKDENGTDITATQGAKVTFETPAAAGTITDGKIKLAQGTSTTVKAVLKDKDGKVVAESKEVKVSAEANVPATISNWTVSATPANFTDKEFKQNNIVYAGDVVTVQTELKDQFGKVTTGTVEYESLNTDAVVVDKTTGKVTVLGAGKAPVKITVKNGDKVVTTKTVELDVRAAKAVTDIKLDQTSLTLSTKDVVGLKPKVTVLDQYGNPVKNAPVTVAVKDAKTDVVETDVATGTDTATKDYVAKTNEKGQVELNVQAAASAKASTYTVEVTTKDKDNKDLKTSLTVDVKAPGVFAKYDVRGLETELDKNAENKDTKHDMTVSVLSVDANGLALGGAEAATVVVKDKDGKVVPAAVTGTKVDATQLAKGDYTVEVSTNGKLVKTQALKVVDSKAALKVEFTSTNIKEVVEGTDMTAALAGILAIDGTPAATGDVTAVKYVTSDEKVVDSTKAVKAGTTTIFVQEVTAKGTTVKFDTPVKVTVNVVKAKA